MNNLKNWIRWTIFRNQCRLYFWQNFGIIYRLLEQRLSELSSKLKLLKRPNFRNHMTTVPYTFIEYWQMSNILNSRPLTVGKTRECLSTIFLIKISLHSMPLRDNHNSVSISQSDNLKDKRTLSKDKLFNYKCNVSF